MDFRKREEIWLLEEKYKGSQTPAFFEDVEKLRQGTPLAYLIGTAPFLGTTIYLDSQPLIPRPETEFWVDHIIKHYLPENTPSTALDIFSGSGCIGVAIAYHRKHYFVDFAELKKEHLLTIQKNLDTNNIEKSRYQIFESNIFENIPKKQYDFIFANPPYISPEKIDTVQDSVLEHEDHIALFAKDDGLFFIKKCIDAIPNFLKENGYIFIEFDPWQQEKIQTYAETKNLYFEFLNDQYQKTRVVIIQNKKLA